MDQLEKLIQAKIPCEETGIEIKRTMCDICTPGPQCGVDAYVKDGVLIKVEGTENFPTNQGALCTKGAANRQYIYREDRIKTPMRRVGERGSHEFEAISWDEAIATIAEKLNGAKEKWGAESVVFMTGYAKWYRAWLQRLSYSFGSPNYITESSTCHSAEVISWRMTYGSDMNPDIMGMPDVLVGWGCNPLVSAYPGGRGYYKYKENGGKIVIIDPRRTPTAVQCADLYIRPRVGTDAYLANTVAALIIENGWADMDFIQNYVHGFEAYRDMVKEYTVEKAVEITGVAEEDIRELARLIGASKTALVQPSNGLTHHINGIPTHRSVIVLNALTGNVGKKGTLLPGFSTFAHMGAGFHTREDDFIEEVYPTGCKAPLGLNRFPLWHDIMPEAQGMDLVRQWKTQDPNPIKVLYAHGVNNRMYLESSKILEMTKDMDFVMSCDLFWTDFCDYADIVLPACSSFERSEVKPYMGGQVHYTTPVIDTLHESKDDVEIITMVANALGLDDALLCAGYDACAKDMFRNVDVDLDAVKAANTLVKVPTEPRLDFFTMKLSTPTGKIELYSEMAAKYSESHKLTPLPVYEDGYGDSGDAEQYPMGLLSGGRIPNAVHSRLHDVPWLRSLRPGVMADLSPEDCATMGIKQGDKVAIVTPLGSIQVKANVSNISAKGEVNIYHGYKEANINQIISDEHLDRHSGFPGFKQIRCRIEKV